MNPNNNNQNPINNPPTNYAPDNAPIAQAQLAYSGFWRRLAASVIDGSIITVVSLLLGLLCTVVLSAQASQVILPIVSILIGIAYFAGLESSAKQATIGKMLVGVTVTDLQGNRISFLRALGRYLGKIVSAAIIFIGFLMIAFTSKKQGLHDIMAGTIVVKNKPVGGGMIFLWTAVSLIISGIVSSLIFGAIFAWLFGSALVSTYNTLNSGVGQSSSNNEQSSSSSTTSSEESSVQIQPMAKSDYNQYLSQSLSSEIVDQLDSPNTKAGSAVVSYDGVFLKVALPNIPNLDGVKSSSYLEIKDIISKTGKDINDAKSDFETDHFFTSLDFSKQTDPSEYLSADRQIHLIDGASDSDIAKIDGKVVLELPTTDAGTTTEMYPFTLSF
jgi:uncharacterized RDD family membrane protein YckC